MGKNTTFLWVGEKLQQTISIDMYWDFVSGFQIVFSYKREMIDDLISINGMDALELSSEGPFQFWKSQVLSEWGVSTCSLNLSTRVPGSCYVSTATQSLLIPSQPAT